MLDIPPSQNIHTFLLLRLIGEWLETMTLQQKITIARDIANITQAQLAERLGISPQSLSKRLKTGKFTDKELENIATILGCEYRAGFYFPDGSKVE